MTEKEFLNVVLQAAGVHPDDFSGAPDQFTKGWTSHAHWETAAQVEIAHHLKRAYVTEAKLREIYYPAPYYPEQVDFYFELDGSSYAVEIKVEGVTGNFAGKNLQEAITRDVHKLHGFNADHRWVVIIAVTQKNRNLLEMTLNRGDSWIYDAEGSFIAYLCNIDTYPHGLPISRTKELSAPYNFITKHYS
ncbi:hypothetical protein [Pseudomonas sp. 3JA]|uniref:hypothetical protein n=1 Tax=Pseudomonas sp. 3JA TaxID=3109347 RepID=UPI00300810F1